MSSTFGKTAAGIPIQWTRTDDPASLGNTIPANESILAEASRLVSGPRANTHGDYHQNCSDASEILDCVFGINLTPVEVSKVMRAMKLARAKQNPTNRDNHVDDVGYAHLTYELEQQLQRTIKDLEDCVHG